MLYIFLPQSINARIRWIYVALFPFIVSIISPNIPYIEWPTRRDNIILLHFCNLSQKINLIRYRRRPVIVRVTDRANYLLRSRWKRRDVHNYLGMRYSMTMHLRNHGRRRIVTSRVHNILFCSNSKHIISYICIVQIVE